MISEEPTPAIRHGRNHTPAQGHDVYSGRRVTLDDIATASGTSIATVSRALQGSPRVASATRERIEKVAEELGYRANVAASLLSSARPQILGLICSLGRELHVRYHSGILRERSGRTLGSSLNQSTTRATLIAHGNPFYSCARNP